MMPIASEFIARFNARWTDALGAVNGHDLMFWERSIEETNPDRVVEIG